jgi:replicative DNA helicase
MSISGVGGSITNRVQEISEISRSLKTLARELSIPIIAMSQLSRAVENRPSKIPQLADLRESGCLTGDTLIQRADTGERVTIQSLVGETTIPVWSLNENFQLEAQMVSKVFSSGYKQTYELRTRSGRTIKASGNHPFLTIHGWKSVEDLKPEMHVAIPRALPQKLSEGSMSDEELILLAHLVGDGCVLPKQPIHYTSSDLENIKVVAKTALELFGICPRIVPQKNWWHVYLPSPYPLTHGKDSPITTWYSRLGLGAVRAPLKKLPQALFSASVDQIRLFLHHLWATDGNISWKNLSGRKPAAAIYYSTTSQELAEQIQHLLLRLGIPSTHRIVPQGKHRPNHQIHVRGAIAQRQFCEKVGCYGARGQIIPQILEALEEIEPNPNQDIIPKEVWGTWVKPVKEAMGIGWREVCAGIKTAYCGNTLFKAGLSRDRMGRLATALQSKALLKLADSGVYWDELVEITPLAVEEVFDATVPGAHNFIANDFIVHNSIEQDADVVLMLYREDYYEEDTERAGITDVFIRKHRNGPTGRVELMFKKEQMRFYDIDRGHEMAQIPEEAFQV